MLKKIFVLAAGLLLFAAPPLPAQSESIEIIETVLARDVADRQPIGAFEPPARCGGTETAETAVPVVAAGTDAKVCLWIKVKSAAAQSLVHTWYKAGIGWEKAGEVTLDVRPSAGFRTWSCKKIVPDLHTGKWMVVVSAASDPENALCKVDFEVK